LPSEGDVPGATQHNRSAVHQHGGFLDWTSDGGPFDWFTPNGNFGPSLKQDSPIRHDASGQLLANNQIEIYQPSQQSARFAWYHDHAVGITRLNAYAGLASAYLITDAKEQWLIKQGFLPNLPGYPLGLPLIIQDKTFVDGTDPNYVWGEKGDLFYPYLYEAEISRNGSSNPKGRWDWGPTAGGTPPSGGWRPLAGLADSTGIVPGVSCVPEYFSDTAIVNGVAYPFLPVEQRHYRFRILDASQARFYNLMLFYESNTITGEVETTTVANADGSASVVPIGKAGPAIVQIGTEGGFLDFPALLNSPPQPCQIVLDPETGNWISGKYNLLLGPGERADVIVDFSNVPTGARLILYNDAPAPFPSGDIRNDYYTGAPDQSANGGAPTPGQGYGPNTRTLMRFEVVARTGSADPHQMNVFETLARIGARDGQQQYDKIMARAAAISPASAVRVRNLTLNEDFDDYGRLIQRLGTDVMMSPTAGTFARDYDSTPTEIVKAGSTEIWRIFNTTGDTHPMHFHLVNVRVLSRRPFAYTVDSKGVLQPTLGTARPADPNENGLKETVRMNPGEMTEILMTFNLPQNLPFPVPFSPRLQKDYGINGYEYVWHCHILEHEEHDMMRPLVIVP
jgi:spore coat protein A